ncbi:MAG: sigma factor-like helix-turn-helix DNA-binding protein, partial [Halioglobus sp.]
GRGRGGRRRGDVHLDRRRLPRRRGVAPFRGSGVGETEEAFELLQRRRSRDRIRELIGGLPSEQGQILAKVYMEGKSHSEVAEELDLPLGTVKSRVRLALQKLQIRIER